MPTPQEIMDAEIDKREARSGYFSPIDIFSLLGMKGPTQSPEEIAALQKEGTNTDNLNSMLAGTFSTNPPPPPGMSKGPAADPYADLEDTDESEGKLSSNQINKILSPKQETPPVWSSFLTKAPPKDEEMANALAQQKSNLIGDALVKSGIIAGRAISGQGANTPILPGAEELSNLPVTQLTEQRKAQYEKFTKEKDMADKQENENPQSKTSVDYRNIMQSMLNMQGLTSLSNAIDGMSAQEIDKKFPMISNIVNAKMAQDARKEAAALAAGYKADIREAKLEDKADKLVKDLKKDLDPDANRTGNFGAISQKVLAAQRMEVLINQFQGGNLPPAQMEELALGLSNMISGQGGRSRAQVEAFVPHTAIGSVNKLKTWIVNDPLGAGQQKFVKMMSDTVQREKEMANTQLNDIRIKRLPAHEQLKELRPELYANQVSEYGIDLDDDNEVIKPEPQKKTEMYTPAQEAGINKVMKDNGASREDVISALKKAGKL
jgi:hypothetical protein